MQNNSKKFYSVKEVADLGLIGFKQRKIREFLKDGRLKGVEFKSGQRKLVKISQESIDDFMGEHASEYAASK